MMRRLFPNLTVTDRDIGIGFMLKLPITSPLLYWTFSISLINFAATSGGLRVTFHPAMTKKLIL